MIMCSMCLIQQIHNVNKISNLICSSFLGVNTIRYLVVET